MRLIDADALIEWIDAGHLRHPTELCFSEMDVVNMINHQPTVEPQHEIIRCKDCEYGKRDDVGRYYCYDLGCQIGDIDGNGFCSDAERRQDG